VVRIVKKPTSLRSWLQHIRVALVNDLKICSNAIVEVTPQIEPVSAPADAPPRHLLRWSKRLGVVAWCVIVFFGCLKLYTAHNDFKIGFHPDEFSKARQLQHDFRNFNHPLLLLEATNWLMAWRGTPQEQKSIILTGREVSAIIAAAGVVGFTFAGYLAAGAPGMILASLAVGLCPSLVVYSHYMKEDAALIGGIGVTVAGMALVWRRRTILAQLAGPMLAGAGAGLAASGKYVGVVAAAGALAAVIAAPWRRWYWIFLRVLLAAALAYGAVKFINHRAFENQADFKEGFDGEYKHGTTGHVGLMLTPPTAFMWNVTRSETQAHVQIFAVALLLAIVTLRRGWGWDLLLLLFTLAWLAVLSYSAIPFHRYGLPVVVLAHAVAALGAARWIEQLKPRRKIWIAASLCTIALFSGLQGYRCRDVLHQFADDSRTRPARLGENEHPAEDEIHSGLLRRPAGLELGQQHLLRTAVGLARYPPPQRLQVCRGVRHELLALFRARRARRTFARRRIRQPKGVVRTAVPRRQISVGSDARASDVFVYESGDTGVFAEVKRHVV